MSAHRRKEELFKKKKKCQLKLKKNQIWTQILILNLKKQNLIKVSWSPNALTKNVKRETNNKWVDNNIIPPPKHTPWNTGSGNAKGKNVTVCIPAGKWVFTETICHQNVKNQYLLSKYTYLIYSEI